MQWGAHLKELEFDILGVQAEWPRAREQSCAAAQSLKGAKSVDLFAFWRPVVKDNPHFQDYMCCCSAN